MMLELLHNISEQVGVKIISDEKGFEAIARLQKLNIQCIATTLFSISQVELALRAGVDAVGMRYPLIRQMMEHPLSQKAELLFARNWAHVEGEDISYLRQALRIEGIAE